MRTATFFSNVNVLPQYFLLQPWRRDLGEDLLVGLLEIGVLSCAATASINFSIASR